MAGDTFFDGFFDEPEKSVDSFYDSVIESFNNPEKPVEKTDKKEPVSHKPARRFSVDLTDFGETLNDFLTDDEPPIELNKNNNNRPTGVSGSEPKNNNQQDVTSMLEAELDSLFNNGEDQNQEPDSVTDNNVPVLENTPTGLDNQATNNSDVALASNVESGNQAANNSNTENPLDNQTDEESDVTDVLSIDDLSTALLGGFDYSDVEPEKDILDGFNIDDIIAHGIDIGASDVHIIPFTPVKYTVQGSIVDASHTGLNLEIPDGDMTDTLKERIISKVLEQELTRNLELDTSYVLRTGRHKGRRTRLNTGKTFGHYYMVFRIISDTIPTLEWVGLSPDSEIVRWMRAKNGLVMINGSTGTGKSTTLAAALNYINLCGGKNIQTAEKPIEYVYESAPDSLVVQREVADFGLAADTKSFENALRSFMRVNPDIILIGEVRDRIEFNALLKASEAGALAISTMHTNGVAETLNRIMSLYDATERTNVLNSLADNARGFANQILIKTTDGKKRFAIRECLTVTREVRDYIGDGNVRAIKKYQEKRGITMEHEILKAVKAGKTTPDYAMAETYNADLMAELLEQAGYDITPYKGFYI